ncbi:MAG TPA: response regulator, partial [Chroococcales cyanobacterium]
KYDLILMDCHMPEMDGFEATVAIRKLQEESGVYTPILAVTALAMAGDRERCIGAGMDDYVPKPIDKNFLQAKINQWLRTDVSYHTDKTRRKVLRSRATLTLVDNEPLNLKELEDFYGMDQMSEMLEIFVKHVEDMLKRLRPMVRDEQSKAAAGVAHELKASCASIGAKQLAKLCLYLEQALGQHDWIEAEETLTSFERLFSALKNYIETSVPA